MNSITGLGVAPTAEQFFVACGKLNLDHSQYMDWAERYADFIVEFEKMGGDIKRCTLFPGTRVSGFPNE